MPLGAISDSVNARRGRIDGTVRSEGPPSGRRPGVYANTMSVAVPARLPDGNGAERSISPILPVRELSATEAAPKGTEK